MSADKKMERTSVGIWRVFAVVVAVALAANAAQAMAGKAKALPKPVSDELPRKRPDVITLLRLVPEPHHVHPGIQMVLCHQIKELVPVYIVVFHNQ